jgi:CHASE2 domain-containing sensor protein
MSSSRPIFRRRPWLDRVAIVLVIAVAILSYKYEDFKEQFPGLISAQMWAYQGLTRLFLGAPQPKWVTPVEIDDATFYDFLDNQSRSDVTDRRYLGELIKAIAAHKPAIIALDINFDAAAFDKAKGNQSDLSEDDQALLKEILNAQKAGIPVVLTFGFREGTVPVPQVFDGQPVLAKDGTSLDHKGISFLFPEREEDPKPEKDHLRTFSVPRYGFDHPADDLRKVPLVVVGPDTEGKGSYDYYSFALQTSDAYSRWAAATPQPVALPPTHKDPEWIESLEDYEFVYTTFIATTDFVSPPLEAFSPNHPKPLSAIEVFCHPIDGKPQWKVEKCPPAESDRVKLVPDLLRNRIVLIGGDRHGYKGEQGEADLIDDHPSPVGKLSGMYFQANYIEGLLDNRVLKPTPRWIAVGLDVIFALLTLRIASSQSGYWARAAIIALMLVVMVVISGVAALTIHRCLDFVFPLVLLLLHPAIESYIHLVPGFRHEEKAHG